MHAKSLSSAIVALATIAALISTFFVSHALARSRLVPARAAASNSPATGPVLAQTDRLTNSAGDDDDLFGTAVALDGNRAIVGAPNVGLGAGAAQGQAYVFVYSDGEWTLEDTLEPDSPIAG